MSMGTAEVKAAFGSILSFATFPAVTSLLCLAGCANPGPPRPPSLQLPALVTDLSAERIGDRVLLRWTTPSRTTDGLDIHGAMTAEICRSGGPGTATSKKSPTACAKVQTSVAIPGASTAFDDLPQTLLADPATLLTYRIQILNAAKHSAGKSTVVAYAASGAAPPSVGILTAAATEAGAVLQWTGSGTEEKRYVDIVRTDLTAATPGHSGDVLDQKHSAPAVLPVRRSKASPPGRQVSSAASTEVHLRASAAGKECSNSAGTVDTTVIMGHTYSYVAQQVRPATIDGHTLEIRSLPSPAIILAMRDTFAPKAPSGLATIPGMTDASSGTPATGYIDLSWEPNIEPDLAGYLVYRRLARPNGDPEGPLGKLSPLPIAAPAYRDVAVVPGQRYIYSVTAVDASGNESAPSAKAQEVAAAQNVGPAQ